MLVSRILEVTVRSPAVPVVPEVNVRVDLPFVVVTLAVTPILAELMAPAI